MATKQPDKRKKTASLYLNILVFSNYEDKPTRYKLSKQLVKNASIFFGLFALVLLVVSSTFIHKYLDADKKLIVLHALKEETTKQKLQIEQFAKNLKIYESQLVKLRTFDKKLRSITALKDNSFSGRTEKWAVGGPGETSQETLAELIDKHSNTALKRLFNDLDKLEIESGNQLLSFQELDKFFKEQSNLLSSMPTIWPVKGWITSGFGYRRSPFTGLREVHDGLDIATRMGAHVLAPADGVVIRKSTEAGYGKMLEIDHGFGFVTRYGHNSKLLVGLGDKVKRGQEIANTGNTGRSTGPHLHYEVVLNGVPVNPLKYILEEQ